MATIDPNAYPFTQEGYFSALRAIAEALGGGVRLLTVSTNLYKGCPDVFYLDSSQGAFTVVLPPAHDMPNRILRFIKISSDSNVITIDGFAGELVGGSTTTTRLEAEHDSICLICTKGKTKHQWHIASADTSSMSMVNVAVSGTMTIDTVNEFTTDAGVSLEFVTFEDGVMDGIVCPDRVCYRTIEVQSPT